MRVNNKMILFGLGVLCWTFWKVRNKMAIEKKLVRSPHEVIYSAISLMQQWRMLLPSKEQDLVKKVSRKIKINVCCMVR
jgi:hypothetical protein